jgi:hypothetical protein
MIILVIIFLILAYFFPGFKRTINTNINLMITMLLGGFWHGSSWMFITWGGLNGIGLIIHKTWEKFNPFKHWQEKLLYRAFMIFLTLTFISFTRIWFRVGSMKDGNWDHVQVFFDRMGNHMGWDKTGDIIWGYKNIMIALLLGYLIHWIPESTKLKYRNAFATLPLPLMGIAVIVIVFSLYQLMSADMQPFIYFQF